MLIVQVGHALVNARLIQVICGVTVNIPAVLVMVFLMRQNYHVLIAMIRAHFGHPLVNAIQTQVICRLAVAFPVIPVIDKIYNDYYEGTNTPKEEDDNHDDIAKTETMNFKS